MILIGARHMSEHARGSGGKRLGEYNCGQHCAVFGLEAYFLVLAGNPNEVKWNRLVPYFPQEGRPKTLFTSACCILTSPANPSLLR